MFKTFFAFIAGRFFQKKKDQKEGRSLYANAPGVDEEASHPLK